MKEEKREGIRLYLTLHLEPMSTPKNQSPLRPLFYLVLFSCLFFSLDYNPYEIGWDILHDTLLVFTYMLGSIIWLLLAVVINRSLNKFIWEGILRKQGKNIPKLMRDMVSSVIMLAAIGGIISVLFKKDLTILLAATGGVGVVVGLALKELIADVFSGLAINVESAFRIGDMIRVGETEGSVMEINWRSTHIRTPHNMVVIIPNSRISSSVVTNLSKMGSHFRSTLTIHLDYSIAPNDGLRTLSAAVQYVQDRILVGEGEEEISLESDVIASNIDDIGVEYQIRYWVSEYNKRPNVRNQIISSVMEQLRRAGMYPCHPQQHVVHEAYKTEEKTEEEKRRELITSPSFFADIDEEEIHYLASSLLKKTYKGGDSVLQRGEKGTSMFFIQDGLVDVYIWIDSQQVERRVASMIAGTSFGEMSLLTGEPRSATIKAKTDVLLYELRKEYVQELLQKRPELAQSISNIIAAYKLRDKTVREKLGKKEEAEEKESLSKQLLGKIQNFFQLS